VIQRTLFNIEEDLKGQKVIRSWNQSWYYRNGKATPSVTFIQDSAEIEYWQILFYRKYGVYATETLRILGDIGTLFHRMVEHFLKYGEIDMKYYSDEIYFIEAWKRLCGFVEFYENFLENQFEIISIESSVFNDEIGYAGTVDLKARALTDKFKKVNIGITKAGLNICQNYIDENKFNNFVKDYERTKKPELIWAKDSIHIFDWKSSAQIQSSHKSQVSAYVKADYADFAHVVCFPEYPDTDAPYSISTLNKDEIEKHFITFLEKKKKFDEKGVKPYDDLPTKFNLKTLETI